MKGSVLASSRELIAKRQQFHNENESFKAFRPPVAKGFPLSQYYSTQRMRMFERSLPQLSIMQIKQPVEAGGLYAR